jgi:hypothetical protein
MLSEFYAVFRWLPQKHKNWVIRISFLRWCRKYEGLPTLFASQLQLLACFEPFSTILGDPKYSHSYFVPISTATPILAAYAWLLCTATLILWDPSYRQSHYVPLSTATPILCPWKWWFRNYDTPCKMLKWTGWNYSLYLAQNTFDFHCKDKLIHATVK